MNIKSEKISISNFQIDVVKKDIKNLHLAVYPPDGRVRISAPNRMDEEVVRLFAISKLGWIKKHIRNFKEQPRESPRSFVSGESHFFQGHRYILEVKKTDGKTTVELEGTNRIHLHIHPKSTREERGIALREWYRREIKKQIPELVSKWEKRIGVKTNEWAVQSMKTKWGSCNIEAKRIWLNLELAKKPQVCLEYIIVHELIHLLERNHTEKFIKYMNQFMPKWRLYRDELNSLPVAHNDWGY